MEHEAFDFYFLAKEFNDPTFEKIGKLGIIEYNRWLSFFRVRSKLEERELKRAQAGKKHSVEFYATSR